MSGKAGQGHTAPLDAASARDLTPRSQALFALRLLVALERVSRAHYAAERLPDREHYLEKAFGLIRSMREESLRAATYDLLVEVVLESHLSTTLRKIGQGLKCSLRFYPDGDVLRATGIPVYASHSGSRLGNLLGMMSDLGLTTTGSDRLHEVTELGGIFLRESDGQ